MSRLFAGMHLFESRAKSVHTDRINHAGVEGFVFLGLCQGIEWWLAQDGDGLGGFGTFFPGLDHFECPQVCVHLNPIRAHTNPLE